ncbi:MAG: NUDIX domain-containing protein [Betaproteobacteria bacterium]
MARLASAGILLYRQRGATLEVFLVHPGGPFWKNKDEGAWSIPKGEAEPGAELLETALREFREETGTQASGDFTALAPLKQKSGKLVHAWALRGDLDAETLVSSTFEMEWPPRSEKMQRFPEVDRGAWLTPDEARRKIVAGQRGFIDQLQALFAPV